MKKLLAVLALIVVFFSLSASGMKVIDVYQNVAFASVIDARNKKMPYEEELKIYKDAVANAGADPVVKLRIELAHVEYINTLDNVPKEDIKAALKVCYEEFENVGKGDYNQTVTDTLAFLIYGIDYCVSGNIISGTKSIGYIDSCYKANKDDAGVMLLYAQRKARAPLIGGGDKKMAIKVLTELLDNIGNYTRGFRYDVYAELGLLYAKSDKQLSQYYYDLAAALY